MPRRSSRTLSPASNAVSRHFPSRRPGGSLLGERARGRGLSSRLMERRLLPAARRTRNDDGDANRSGMRDGRRCAHAQHVSEHQGTKYYFCGKGCKLDFEEDPEHLPGPCVRAPHVTPRAGVPAAAAVNPAAAVNLEFGKWLVSTDGPTGEPPRLTLRSRPLDRLHTREALMSDSSHTHGHVRPLRLAGALPLTKLLPPMVLGVGAVLMGLIALALGASDAPSMLATTDPTLPFRW